MSPAARRSTVGPLRALRRIVRWYVATVYGIHEGPGVLPFYCDRARVGHFAVDPSDLAQGEERALFRLLVLLAMYQSKRDVDVMRRQRTMAREMVEDLASPERVGKLIGGSSCRVLREAGSFDARCSVRRSWPPGAAACDVLPDGACHVKDATMAIGRMGDMGKIPTSAALHLGPEGGLTGLFRRVCSREGDPARRAEALVCEVARIHRVGVKIATLFVSALATEELAPGLAPWATSVAGSALVVVDTNVVRVIDALTHGEGPRTYAARATLVRGWAARIDLRRLDLRLPTYAPRVVQQALYSFRSASNRRDRDDACAGRSSRCRACVPAICPFGLS